MRWCHPGDTRTRSTRVVPQQGQHGSALCDSLNSQAQVTNTGIWALEKSCETDWEHNPPTVSLVEMALGVPVRVAGVL